MYAQNGAKYFLTALLQAQDHVQIKPRKMQDDKEKRQSGSS